ncbi:MAG TPA: peptide ABC transporter substrate-binding protein [Dehalococcoidia bacterium]|nr:peptide ABC transporter substrate-binding protein [Dehalococcoidia bacterium]
MTHRRVPRPQWPLLLALFLGVAAIAVFWFIIANPLDSSPDEDSEQRYVEAIVGSAARINPLFAPLNDTDADLAALIFSGLTRLGPDGEVLPDLAESWEISDDGLSYTFHLRSDVIWHTGAAFSANDAVFTYGLLADPELPGDPALGQLWRQVSCSAADALTLVCELPQPFAPFLSYTTVGILPKHILESATGATIAEDAFNQAPAGTGPYRLAQLDQTKAILRANPTYYGAKPVIDEIEVRFYPDASTAAAALSRGEVQGLLLGPGVSQDDFDLVTSTAGLRAYTANRTAYTVLFLNNGQPPFDDKALRRAVALSINVDDIISNLLGGRAVRADSPIVPGTWAYNPQLEPRPYDTDEAKKILDEAGWKTDDGAVRQKEGTELRITLMTDQDQLRIAIAQEIANQLSKVGIQVVVAPQGSADLVGEFLVPHQYQAAIFGWDPGPDPDPYPAWHSSQVGPEGRNLAAYQDPDADHILEEARQTTDLDKREALYYTFQQKFLEDVPSVLIYYPVFTYFVAEEVKDVQLGTLFQTSSRFAGIADWTIGEAPQLIGG